MTATFSKQMKDCRASFDKNIFQIENSRIERRYRLIANRLLCESVKDKKSGFAWKKETEEFLLPPFQGFDFLKATLEFSGYTDNNDGLSEEFLCVLAHYTENEKAYTMEWRIFPDTPFISFRVLLSGHFPAQGAAEMETAATGIEANRPEQSNLTAGYPDGIDFVPLPHRLLDMEIIRLNDKTDHHDNLIERKRSTIYEGATVMDRGNFLCIKDHLSKNRLLLIKESTTHLNAVNHGTADFAIQFREYAQVLTSGAGNGADGETACYGCTIGVGTENIYDDFKDFYRKQFRGNPDCHSFVMSNTWGDRSMDSAICEKFILEEVDAAHQIGADIVQIDDGWENGATANSLRNPDGVWEGYYAFCPDFWKPEPKQFPNGLSPVAKRAKEYGMRIGLWFSPDSTNDFANWQKDVDTLYGLYQTYGIRDFKLDGVKIRSKTGEHNYLAILKKLTQKSGGAITFNQDITAEDRLGYLYERQFGTLFVENRYTDWGNYYPHRTLKNVWQLSSLFPLEKFQFEVLNNRRNESVYASDDILAPSHYTIDYTFAITMLANPLLWMETSHLCESDRKCLARCITVYRKCRDDFFRAKVTPIGNMPDGLNFTGFQIECENGKGYFLIFRETTRKSNFSYQIRPVGSVKLTCLLSNAHGGSCSFAVHNDSLDIVLQQPRSYLLLKYEP